jgi:glycosyltransferase involved in cell wall biosynthesis
LIFKNQKSLNILEVTFLGFKQKMKIKILHCIETISSGGVEQTILTLVKGLDPANYEHKIICTWHGGPVSKAFLDLGVELIPIGKMNHPFELRQHWKVWQVISTFRPHLVHGAVFEGMSRAIFSGVLRGVPVIILEETSDPQNRSQRANWLLRQYIRFANKIMAISPEVADYLREVSGIHPTKISLISNGVNEPDFPATCQIEAERERLKFGSNDIVIGFIGRFYNDHKRMTDLIEAFSYLKEKKTRLLLVGDGKDKPLVIEKIKKMGLKDKVIMVGYQANTSLYYSLMDIFCIPSSREGFGLVAAEAMMHSLPVIASKVGGLKDVVLDGETGFLVPPFSPKEIADKIQFLTDNPDLRKEMGEKGKVRASQNYSADRYVKEVENLYLSLLIKNGIKF